MLFLFQLLFFFNSLAIKLQQIETKGNCRKLPSIALFDNIPELIVVNSWNDDIDLNLEIQSKEIIVDVKCGEAVIRGADIFAPGVIGMPHGK